MRDRFIIGPLLKLWWWLRGFPTQRTVKAPLDLRVEGFLWSLGGHADIARICRLRAEGSDQRDSLERDLDTVALVGTVLLVVFTVVYLAAQIVRFAVA